MAAPSTVGDTLLPLLRQVLTCTDEVLKNPGPHTLRDLELDLDPLLAELRALLFSFEVDNPDGSKALNWGDQAGATVQTLVALSDFYDVVSLILQSAGFDWGSHLFSRDDFRHTTMVRLADHKIAPLAYRELLGGTSVAMLLAIQQLAALSLAGAHDAAASKNKIEDISRIHGRGPQSSLGGSLQDLRQDCLDRDAVNADLGATVVDALIADDKIFKLRGWSGQDLFPDFQFYGGAVEAVCQWLLEETDLPRNSWSVCLWVHLNIGKPLEWFQHALEQRCRVKHQWSEPDHIDYADAISFDVGVSIPAGSRFIRITPNRFVPFFFSVAPADPVANGGPGGRYDVAAGTGRGSNYATNSAEVACREVFEHTPVASLSDLLSRTVWALTPLDEVTRVCDLRGMNADVSATPIRSRTQGLATFVAEKTTRGSRDYNAMMTPTRTGGSEAFGLVLFGDASADSQAGLPGANSHGAWQVEHEAAISHADVWTYVSGRYDDDQEPFLVQRLPSDVQVNIAVAP